MTMEKNILLLCCGYPYKTDTGVGYHVAQRLAKIKLPDYVDFMEVGESACMIPGFIEGKDKLIIVDAFRTGDKPGTVVKLKPEEVPHTVDGLTDIPQFRLVETIGDIKLSGKCPESIFIGIVPKDITTSSMELTPEVEAKIAEVIAMILKELE